MSSIKIKGAEINSDKKLLYLASWNKSNHTGVNKKIESQCKALSKYFLVTSVYVTTYRESTASKLFTSILKVLQILITNKFTHIYIRNFTGINAIFLMPVLIVASRKKIIVEIPTFPIEHNKSLASYIDNTIKCSLYRFIVNDVLYMGKYTTSKIWGVRSSLFNNGVDIDEIHQKMHIVDNNSEINFIGLAILSHWHGYDRLIRSIYFHKDLKCKFTIVGNGPELQNLQTLVRQLKLERYIFFEGYKEAYALNLLFDKSHIAVDSLGRHRVGTDVNFSLKSREYTARGIPFIYSHEDYFLNGCTFAYKVPSDDSIIDLPGIVDWYKNSMPNSNAIRDYAEVNFSWSKIFDNYFQRNI